MITPMIYGCLGDVVIFDFRSDYNGTVSKFTKSTGKRIKISLNLQCSDRHLTYHIVVRIDYYREPRNLIRKILKYILVLLVW